MKLECVCVCVCLHAHICMHTRALSLTYTGKKNTIRREDSGHINRITALSQEVVL